MTNSLSTSLSTSLTNTLTARIRNPVFYYVNVLVLVLFSGLVHAGNRENAEGTEPLKAPIKIHYDKQSIKNSAVNNATSSSTRPSKMSNGLIKIKNIRLQGDTLFPEYGITTKFLHDRVNQVYSHMNKKLSINDMNRIADTLTLAYREKGLTFNRAYVVPQEITQSTLTIHVLKGTLAAVDIYNNSLYSKEQITAPFAKLMGKVLYEPDVKKAVASLNQKPGLKIFSFFSLGSKQGEARLNVRVTEETQHQSEVTVDNKGVDQTGVNRAIFSHTINNPFSLSGRLRGTLLTTDKKDNYFGSLTYSAPISQTNQLSLSVLRSDFAVSGQFTDLGIKGDLSAATLAWSNQPANNKQTKLSHNRLASISTKQSNVTSDEFSEFFDEKVDYTMLSGTYQLQWLGSQQPGTRQPSNQHNLSITPSVSAITASDNASLPSEFWLLASSYVFMAPIWTQAIPLYHPFSISFKGQYTSDQLPSSEQYATTGASANRGFEPGIFSADSAYTASIEQAINWSFNITEQSQRLTLQPFLFFDYSYGELNSDADLSASFQSMGIGLKAIYNKRANAGITIGHPLDHNVSSQLNIDQKQAVTYAHFSFGF